MFFFLQMETPLRMKQKNEKHSIYVNQFNVKIECFKSKIAFILQQQQLQQLMLVNGNNIITSMQPPPPPPPVNGNNNLPLVAHNLSVQQQQQQQQVETNQHIHHQQHIHQQHLHHHNNNNNTNNNNNNVWRQHAFVNGIVFGDGILVSIFIYFFFFFIPFQVLKFNEKQNAKKKKKILTFSRLGKFWICTFERMC